MSTPTARTALGYLYSVSSSVAYTAIVRVHSSCSIFTLATRTAHQLLLITAYHFGSSCNTSVLAAHSIPLRQLVQHISFCCSQHTTSAARTAHYLLLLTAYPHRQLVQHISSCCSQHIRIGSLCSTSAPAASELVAITVSPAAAVCVASEPMGMLLL